jgi:hypothetical protein
MLSVMITQESLFRLDTTTCRPETSTTRRIGREGA